MSSSNDVWGEGGDDGAQEPDRSQSSEDGAFSQAESGEGDQYGEDANGDGVIDAEVTEVAPKKSKILPILIGVGAVALAFAGYIGYTFYQKFFPSAGSQETSVGILAEDLPPSEPPARTSVPMGANSDAPFTGGSSGVVPIAEGGPAVTPEQVSIDAMKDAPIVAPVVVETPVVATAPAVAVAPSLPSSAEAAVTPVTPTTSTTPAVILSKPLVCSEVCPQDEIKPAAVAKKKVAPQPVRRVVVAKAPVKKPVAAAPVASEGPAELGKLTNYTVLAFEPKTGPYQQAWIRGRDDRIFVVREGDTLEGARVTSVNFASGAVMTSRGEIRK